MSNLTFNNAIKEAEPSQSISYYMDCTGGDQGGGDYETCSIPEDTLFNIQSFFTETGNMMMTIDQTLGGTQNIYLRFNQGQPVLVENGIPIYFTTSDEIFIESEYTRAYGGNPLNVAYEISVSNLDQDLLVTVPMTIQTQ